jgi:peroxiredoxin (alkyl hydroperoxide reductase subunit C)
MLLFLGFAGFVAAQDKNQTQIPLIGSDALKFSAETTTGTLNFPADFGRSWKILFSHPKDFTPVCTTEILELARLQKRMSALGIRVAVISTDTKERHLMWKKSMEEILKAENSASSIDFPLIDDSNATISKLYGMLHKPVSTTKDVRGVFVFNPDNKVEATFFYPISIGRNMEEIIRTVEALQTSYATSLLTPVNWVPGDDLLVPHFPYTEKELANNPGIEKQYYQSGSLLWYKKGTP